MEKTKRKLEGDLRCTQETLADLERHKNEISQTIQRKEKEMAAIAAKIEDEQTLGGKMQKQCKELGVRKRGPPKKFLRNWLVLIVCCLIPVPIGRDRRGAGHGEEQPRQGGEDPAAVEQGAGGVGREAGRVGQRHGHADRA